MKTTMTFLLAAVFTAGTFRTDAQQSGASPTNATSLATAVAAGAPASMPPAAAPAPAVPAASAEGTNGLRLNFRGAPLESVLDYLSDAAGFIIVLDTPVSGHVDLWSDQPVTKDEAVDLLNSVLNKNGYAAIRDGRTLTIMNKNDAKTRNIPVRTGNDPDAIPDNDEIATWIVPIRFVEARQLSSDLSSFVSPQATIVANEAGNSIVVTDTQSNIRHLAQIIRAVDNSAEGETEIRVFHLQHANPNDVASELGSIFPNNSSGGTAQSPFRFGGGGGGPGGFFARIAAANAANNNQNAAVQKNSQVVAVADARTQSVIVTASKDLMEQIAGMMEQLDVPSDRDQGVYVFQMKNGDPQQAVQVLQDMFQSSSTSRSGTSTSSSQSSPLQQRAQTSATTMGTTTTGTTGAGGAGYNSGGTITGR